jgi:hypothetical protein
VSSPSPEIISVDKCSSNSRLRRPPVWVSGLQCISILKIYLFSVLDRIDCQHVRILTFSLFHSILSLNVGSSFGESGNVRLPGLQVSYY